MDVGFLMRRLGTLLLVGLLAACPLLCRAAEESSPSDQCGAPEAPSRVPHSCPDDGVTCICAGAVQGHEARVVADVTSGLPFFDLVFEGLPEFVSPPATTPHGASRRLTGHPFFLDALTIRALLQNFRF